MLGVAREIFEKYNFEEEKNIFFEKKNFLAFVPPVTQVFPQRVSAHSVQPFGQL